MPAHTSEPTARQLDTSFGTVEYSLTRSIKRRRTMEIRIRPSGDVQVSAPNSFTVSAIEGFLKARAQWIIKKTKIFRDRRNLMVKRDLGCLYLGKSYPVCWRVGEEQWSRLNFDDQGWDLQITQSVRASIREQYSKDFLEKWFKGRAKIILGQRVAHYARLMDENPADIRIRSPKSLWGSCHPLKKVLHFNWKIIMAPLEVVDYVVVHELSHIQAPNHSQRFWARVGRFSPDYKAHRDWLKENSYRFVLTLG